MPQEKQQYCKLLLKCSVKQVHFDKLKIQIFISEKVKIFEIKVREIYVLSAFLNSLNWKVKSTQAQYQKFLIKCVILKHIIRSYAGCG